MNTAQEIKSIEEKEEKVKLGEYLTLTWYFDKWYEKLFLMVMTLLGVWKILNLINVI